MPRTGHYLKTTSGASAPSALASVVVDTTLSPLAPESAVSIPAHFGGAHLTYTRRTARGWSEPVYRYFDTRVEFWQWLESWHIQKRRLYVFAPVASDALVLLDFWERVDRLGALQPGQTTLANEMIRRGITTPAFRFRRLVQRAKPDIIEYSFNSKDYTWLSTQNYWDLTLDALSSSVGFMRTSTAPSGTTNTSTTWTPQERCALYLQAARQLGEWWLSLNAGRCGATIGQCALSFCKSRTAPKAVATHQDDRAIRLERMACHGGRASTWYYGESVALSHDHARCPIPFPRHRQWNLGRTLYHLDVRSMYVSLLASIDTPTKLISISYDETPDGVASLCKRYCVVANVTLKSPVAEYPHRRGLEVWYPVGRYQSILCGDELVAACAAGLVTHVHCTLIYAKGKPFQRAGQELLQMREDARRRNDPGWESFVKLLGNSLTGKFAQRGGLWEERPHKAAERDWGEWIECDFASGKNRRFRAVAGMVTELVRDARGNGLMPAVYAHLTAAGRMMMTRIRAQCPDRSVVSQDTDGMWAIPEAADILRSHLGENEGTPGHLRIVTRSTATRFWSPKHYWAANRWTLSGLHNPSTLAADLSFQDEYTQNTIRGSSHEPPTTVNLVTREVTLSCLPHDGVIGEDGWLIPASLPRRVTRIQGAGVEPAALPFLDPPDDSPGV